MVDETRLKGLVEQLNEAMGEVTPYKLAVVPPGDIEPLKKNAHYMSKQVYDQLTANVKQDGNLSSLPFCWKKSKNKFVCLSGNHRVKVAKEAGVPLILILYTDQKLSRSKQVAIQLSHNALVGQDNPAILRELWDEIADVKYKIYSGLDEEVLETMAPVTIARINEESLKFDELVILFLSPEIDRIEDTLERLGSVNKKRLAAKYDDFNRFFENLLDYKEATGILNTATAFMSMIEIIEDWLKTHKQEIAHSDISTIPKT